MPQARLWTFSSGPSPEDAVFSDVVEGLIERQHGSVQIIDTFPFSPVRPVPKPDFVAGADTFEGGDRYLRLQQILTLLALSNDPIITHDGTTSVERASITETQDPTCQSGDTRYQHPSLRVVWFCGRKDTRYHVRHRLMVQARHPGRPIRWVLIRDPDGKREPQAFFSPSMTLEPAELIALYVCRWPIEVTFAETRADLGVGTQRQWTDNAIARTTPTLLGLFSLISLWACDLLTI